MKATAYLWVCLGLCVATTARAENKLSPDAKQHFDAGIAYVDDPVGAKYEEAYREFKLAYAESPTYLLLANIGYCAFYIERDEEAIEALEGYLAQATDKDIPKKKRDQMVTDIKTLKASLVRVTYRTTPKQLRITDERVSAKGSTVINRYEVKDGKLSLGIHPGHHRITAETEGYEAQTWTVEMDSASTHEHEFKLKPLAQASASPALASASASAANTDSTLSAPPETPKKTIPTSVYVGAAATGVFAVAATVTGLMTLSKKSDFDDVNRDGKQPDQARNLENEGRLYALLTDIGLGAAIVSAAVTTYLYVSSSSGKAETKTPVGRVRLQPIVERVTLQPTVGRDRAALTISGKF